MLDCDNTLLKEPDISRLVFLHCLIHSFIHSEPYLTFPEAHVQTLIYEWEVS